MACFTFLSGVLRIAIFVCVVCFVPFVTGRVGKYSGRNDDI